jgi:hypothetical protein
MFGGNPVQVSSDGISDYGATNLGGKVGESLKSVRLKDPVQKTARGGYAV